MLRARIPAVYALRGAGWRPRSMDSRRLLEGTAPVTHGLQAAPCRISTRDSGATALARRVFPPRSAGQEGLIPLPIIPKVEGHFQRSPQGNWNPDLAFDIQITCSRWKLLSNVSVFVTCIRYIKASRGHPNVPAPCCR